MKDSGMKIRDRRNGDWFWMDKVIVDKYAAQIGPYALAVYNALCFYANSDQKSWPSMNTIAKKLKISRLTVLKSLQILEKEKLVKKVSKSKGKSCEYLLLKSTDLSMEKRKGVSEVYRGCISDLQGGVSEVYTNKNNIEQELKNKGKKNSGDISKIKFLGKRYNQNLLSQIYDAICSTRKSEKIFDNVWLSQLEKWQEYPVQQVEAGIRVYLEKEYHIEGKGEKYLLGIIKNQKIEDSKPVSRGSDLLDKYYGISN